MKGGLLTSFEIWWTRMQIIEPDPVSLAILCKSVSVRSRVNLAMKPPALLLPHLPPGLPDEVLQTLAAPHIQGGGLPAGEAISHHCSLCKEYTVTVQGSPF